MYRKKAVMIMIRIIVGLAKSLIKYWMVRERNFKYPKIERRIR